MSFSNKIDKNLTTLAISKSARLPVVSQLSVAGDHPTQTGQILFADLENNFYGHNGTTWIPFGGGSSGSELEWTPYTVSASVQYPAAFTTIQAAIDQAVADGVSIDEPRIILVRPGVYTENISLPRGVSLMGAAPAPAMDFFATDIVGLSLPVEIQGEVSFTALQTGDIATISRIQITNTNANCILYDPVGVASVYIQNCWLSHIGAGDAVNSLNASTGNLVFRQCIVNGSVSADGVLLSFQTCSISLPISITDTNATGGSLQIGNSSLVGSPVQGIEPPTIAPLNISSANSFNLISESIFYPGLPVPCSIGGSTDTQFVIARCQGQPILNLSSGANFEILNSNLEDVQITGGENSIVIIRNSKLGDDCFVELIGNNCEIQLTNVSLGNGNNNRPLVIANGVGSRIEIIQSELFGFFAGAGRLVEHTDATGSGSVEIRDTILNCRSGTDPAVLFTGNNSYRITGCTFILDAAAGAWAEGDGSNSLTFGCILESNNNTTVNFGSTTALTVQ